MRFWLEYTEQNHFHAVMMTDICYSLFQNDEKFDTTNVSLKIAIRSLDTH